MNKFYKISWLLIHLLFWDYDSVNAEPIVNGDIVDIKHYPYQVYLSAILLPTCLMDSWLVKIFPCMRRKGLFCGGSIINKRYILTAAHCLENVKLHKVEIYAGANRIGDPEAQIHTAQAFIVHPQFDKYALKYNKTNSSFAEKKVNDIALVRLNEDIQFTEVIRPVKLPKSNYRFQDGDTAVVAGWGDIVYRTGPMSKYLRATQQKVIIWESCARHWRTKSAMHIDTGMLCAVTDHDWASGSCMGDSGGPFVDDKGYQIGITSFGWECGKTYLLPDVYVNVIEYAKWIRKNTKI